MRYLKLVILVSAYALIPPAFARTCCPTGCVQDGNRCETTGPLWTKCTPIPCAGGTQLRITTANRPARSPSGGSFGGQTYAAPVQPAPQCISMNPTKAQLDEATNNCVNALTRNAQFSGCRFEDDAGRAEDQRTGLSCPERQAVLAKQCPKRCADYASATTRCAGMDPNSVWHMFFGDISGGAVGSARVERCGPPLRASVSSRRQPPPRSGP